MLNTGYLILIILGVALQSVFKKPYTEKTGGGGAYFFNMLVSLSAMLFFVFTSRNIDFNADFLPYSLGFALSYAVTSVFSVLAIAEGSLSLTSLFISYSLLIPTLYGLIFLGDSVSALFLPAMALLLLSLFLVNKSDEKSTVTVRWIVYVVLAAVGNGFCSVVQKMQQVAFSGDYKNEFMIVALAVSTLIMAVMTAFTERKGIVAYARFGWHFAIICGIMNGAVNLFVMILSGRMPVALMFPLVSAGGLVLTYFMSSRLYRERLTKTQLWGFALGVVSIILFNV